MLSPEFLFVKDFEDWSEYLHARLHVHLYSYEAVPCCRHDCSLPSKRVMLVLPLTILLPISVVVIDQDLYHHEFWVTSIFAALFRRAVRDIYHHDHVVGNTYSGLYRTYQHPFLARPLSASALCCLVQATIACDRSRAWLLRLCLLHPINMVRLGFYIDLLYTIARNA